MQYFQKPKVMPEFYFGEQNIKKKFKKTESDPVSLVSR